MSESQSMIVSKPKIISYDRACLRMFGGDSPVIKALLDSGWNFSIQVLEDEKIISLVIKDQCLVTREIDQSAKEGVLLNFIRYLTINYKDEVDARIEELQPKKRQKKASPALSKFRVPE
jgi:hypothetical protein